MKKTTTRTKTVKTKKKGFWKIYFKELKKNLKAYFLENKIECLLSGFSLILWVLGLKKKHENKKKVKFYDELRDGKTYYDANDNAMVVTLNKDHSFTTKPVKEGEWIDL